MDSLDENESLLQDESVPSLKPLCTTVPCTSQIEIETAMKHLCCYIEELHEEERKILADIFKLESTKREKESIKSHHTETEYSRWPSVELVQVNVSEVSNKTFVVSITCEKKNGSMISVCKALESLNLHLIKFNLSSLPQSILFTLFVQSEKTTGALKEIIKRVISQN